MLIFLTTVKGIGALRIEFLRCCLDALQVCKVHNKQVGIFASKILELFEGRSAFGLITGSDPNFGVLG